MYSLLCTTRFDRVLESYDWNDAPDGTPSPYLLLAYQLDRLVSSARLCRWTVSLSYATLKHVCDEAARGVNGVDGESPLKIRVVVAPSGDITASASTVEPLRYDPIAASRFVPGADTCIPPLPILSICIDTQPTSGTVSIKTTDRKLYDDARARTGIPPLGAPPVDTSSHHPDDVLLFNTSGAVMETSIYNVAFYRNGRWLTPPLTVGCISGVLRRWLLENGCVHESEEHAISVDTIQDDEWVLVFNGVSGCRLGRVCRNSDVHAHES